MADHNAETAQPCPDGLTFDPTPWLTSSMAASCQARWSSAPKLSPRLPYCQVQGHYPGSIFHEPSTPPASTPEEGQQ